MIEPKAENKPETQNLEMPELVRQAVAIFSDEMSRFQKTVADFNQKRDATHKRIERGARRTSGRIV